MELKVNEITLPEQITFNYEELKEELIEKVQMYETLVYDDSQIKEAKADKANLNKLKKALNDERIRREKEYMQPFNDFKSKINEIISIIDKPVAVIDKQIKSYEEQKKQEKAGLIDEYMKEIEKELPDNMHIPFNDKWLNASVSMKSIQEEINTRLEQIKNDLATLSNLPEFAFEAAEVYKSTLDLAKAVNEAHRLSEMAKKKAEYEAEQEKLKEEASRARIVKPEENPIPAQEGFMNPSVSNDVENDIKKSWVAFKCLLSVEDAKALGEFFRNRNIAYEQI